MAICRTLAATAGGFITSRGYRAAKTRPLSDRALKDEVLLEIIVQIHEENYGVYGVRKMWHAMRRAGWDVGRDQVARLMRKAGLRGVVRGRTPVTTTRGHQTAARPDLVDRTFSAECPNRLWVADITYVRTTSGFCYTAFVTDVCTRRIVGWATRSTMRTDALPLEALEHALTAAQDHACAGLIHHSDQGSQYVSWAYSARLEEAGVKASVGSVGDAYDNALAETVNGLYKTELIYARPHWTGVTEVEFATMDWVHWWNNIRLHQALGYQTPAEYEAQYYRERASVLAPA